MKSNLLAIFLIVLATACERVVEVEDPVPEEVRFCALDTTLAGRWVTDSVWVITRVDTLDSLIENRNPGIFYEMTLVCADRKEFLLTYTGFHNITTVDVRSANYETVGNTIFAYDPFDATQDTSDAGFRMPYQLVNDTLLNSTMKQDLGSGQESTYYLFFRKARQ